MELITEPTREQLVAESLDPDYGPELAEAMSAARDPNITWDTEAQQVIMAALAAVLDTDLHLGTKGGICCGDQFVPWTDIIQVAQEEHQPERWASWLQHQLFASVMPLSDSETLWAGIVPSGIYSVTRGHLLVFTKGTKAIRAYQRGTRRTVDTVSDVTLKNFYEKAGEMGVTPAGWRLML